MNQETDETIRNTLAVALGYGNNPDEVMPALFMALDLALQSIRSKTKLLATKQDIKEGHSMVEVIAALLSERDDIIEMDRRVLQAALMTLLDVEVLLALELGL